MTDAPAPTAPPRRPRKARASTLTAYGEPMLWLTNGGLAVSLVMIVGLLLLVVYSGITTFWPQAIVKVETPTGDLRLGEVTRQSDYLLTLDLVRGLDPATQERVIPRLRPGFDEAVAELRDVNEILARDVVEAVRPDEDGWPTRLHELRGRLREDTNRIEDSVTVGALYDAVAIPATRRLIRTANFDLFGTDFTWVSDFEVVSETRPAWAMVVERLEWGRFYGTPVAFRIGDEVVATTEGLEGEALDQARAEIWRAFSRHHPERRRRWAERRRIEKHDIGRINHAQEQGRLNLREIEIRHGRDSDPYREAAEAWEIRNAELQERFVAYRARITEINEENDRFVMTMEASDGRRIDLRLAEAVRAFPPNQLGFGSRVRTYLGRWGEFLFDEPRDANMEGGVWPAIFGTFVMTVLMSVAVVPFGVLAALYLREYAKAGTMISVIRIAINNLAGVPSIVFGVFGVGFFCYLVGGTIDEVFFQARLPAPTYGTPGILWASLTLALLTLPVVIVATEEALAAVPGSMREGSYACGASKWQTIKRIVLPRAMPGIMTGMILSMARGAGEVAPLMLVGAVKLAPELPVDGYFPYIHPYRSFMHLGFHIFDLGFQSRNAEAAKPMVFTTTLLLIGIVFFLNIVAVLLRNRLRRKFVTSAV